jgi:leucyl-tRNA synthetase
MADVQRKLVLMLAPFAPYLAHELWETLGETSDLLRAPWPQYDRSRAGQRRGERSEIGIQVNGKIRSRIGRSRRRNRRSGERAGPHQRENHKPPSKARRS